MTKKPKSETQPETSIEEDGAEPLANVTVLPPEAPSFKTELSETAKEELRKQAHAKVQQELIKAEKDKFLAQELERMRRSAGLGQPNLGGIHDELVKITMDLGYDGSAFIQLNQPFGKCYYHGQTYEVPRHVANSLNEIMWRGMLLTRSVKGESVYRNRNYGTRISGIHGITNGAVH